MIQEDKKIRLRKRMVNLYGRLFYLAAVTATILGIATVLVLIIKLAYDSAGWLNWSFITGTPSRFASKTGIYPVIMGSLFTVAITAVLCLVLGVGAAINLEEYMHKGRLKQIIETNIANLAGIPSIVYGLLGLGIFVGYMDMKPGIVIVGAFTLTLRILPIMIISAQEALRAVPGTLREASYSLGATKWETIRHIVIPEAVPGIMTGTILALANAVGETAPLIMIGVATSIFSAPEGLFSPFGALPLQIFAWSDFPGADFQHGVVPAAIVVLLVMLLLFNGAAIIIRNKFQKGR